MKDLSNLKLETLNMKLSMAHHYSPKKLSEREWRVIEEILLEEMETQEWFTVAVIGKLETFIVLQ